jgi:putative SOS response-associated peptidase YedK
MCGRYASSRRPEDLVEEFEIDKVEVKEALTPDFNVAPTKQVYAVVQRPPAQSGDGAKSTGDDGAPADGGKASGQQSGASERQLRTLRWGLVPFWAKDPAIGNKLINARMETVHEKPAFRRAFAARRCLLPADGYFEWYPTEQKTKAGKPLKQPFFIHPADGGVMAMAGLYEIWRDPTRDEDDPQRFLWTCTVLTTTAEDAVGHIHDRMPLLVEPDRYAAWLDPTHGDVDDLTKLLVPAAPGRLEAYPVSTAVNSVRNNGPELVEPIEHAEAGPQG